MAPIQTPAVPVRVVFGFTHFPLLFSFLKIRSEEKRAFDLRFVVYFNIPRCLELGIFSEPSFLSVIVIFNRCECFVSKLGGGHLVFKKCHVCRARSPRDTQLFCHKLFLGTSVFSSSRFDEILNRTEGKNELGFGFVGAFVLF